MVNSNEELKPKVVGGGDVKREEVESLVSLVSLASLVSLVSLVSLEEDLVNMEN